MAETANNATATKPAMRLALAASLAIEFWPATCAECSTRFLVEATMLATHVEAGKAIYCPRGHAFHPDAGVRALIVNRLSDELTAARFELHRLQLMTRRHRHARDTDPQQAMKIAARAMAAAADVAERGRRQGGKVCPICGFGSTSERSLFRHIIRRHKAELGGPATA